MNKARKVRVLMSKHILECHDRGIKTVIRLLQDAGFEVIYNIYKSPAEIVATAVEEDVDAIGLSFFSGAYLENVPDLMELMEKKGLRDVLVTVGGLIPDVDEQKLLKLGVKGVFGPGSSLTGLINLIKDHAAARTA